ncbi:MAG: hypothetical protein AB8B79_02780 [Granulosicoccus sp.]
MTDTVGFSERQLHCLEAMGIVPWVSRQGGSVAPASTVQVPSTLSASNLPDTMPELGLCLPDRLLANFGYKGAVHTTLGHPEAPVLVVVQRFKHNDKQESDTDLPLTGDSAQLFELMMRSIGLNRSDVLQCALADSLLPGHDQSICESTVGRACTAHTRAVLVLMPMDDSNDIRADANHCRLAESGLPTWRIAHPELLLQENWRKRQAWQVLKALQQHLAA